MVSLSACRPVDTETLLVKVGRARLVSSVDDPWLLGLPESFSNKPRDLLSRLDIILMETTISLIWRRRSVRGHTIGSSLLICAIWPKLVENPEGGPHTFPHSRISISQAFLDTLIDKVYTTAVFH
jgi:hypothetical protein